MKKISVLILLLMSWASICNADNFAYGSKYQGSNPVAQNIRTDTDNFDGNLSAADINVQSALETIDDLIVSSAGISRTIVVTSGNVTAGSAASTDYVYLVAGAHTVTLPTAVANTNKYSIKNNHSANITVATTAAQTIDGTTTISLAPQESVDIISDTANWRIQ